MGFSEPVVNEGARYTVLFHTDPSVPNASATVDITVNVGEGDWTGDGLDGLFQGLVDLVNASPLFEFVQARKAQTTNSDVTPTVAEVDESP